MCQATQPAVDSRKIIADRIGASSTVEVLPTRKLNPSALEFVSSRSESEASSIADPAESEENSEPEDRIAVSDPPTKSGPNTHTNRPGSYYMDQNGSYSEDHHRYRSHPAFGWESPQGVLPPGPYMAPHPQMHYAAAPSGDKTSPTQTSPGEAIRTDATAFPPSGPPNAGPAPPSGAPTMSQHPNASHQIMPAYSWGPATYPVYHVYPHPDHSSAGGPMERAASPPPMFPNGSSPPLAPGFISVPVHTRMEGGSPPGMMFGGSPPHSLGTSPPGAHHYLYMAHPPHPGHHAYPTAHHGHPPMHGGSPPGAQMDLQHRMNSMNLQQGAGSVEGGSPHSSSAGGSTPGRRESGRASARIARSHRAGGAYNPSDFEFKVEKSEAECRTTVMVRNIPNKYNQAIMLSMLQEAGLKGTFDFFYLPIDFRNRCGLGYAFVNFLTHADAVKAYSHFHQRRWDEFNSKKVCEITYARVQGRDQLVHHFKAAKFPSSDAEYCPLVFERGTKGEDSEELEAHSPLPIHEFLELQERKDGVVGDA